MKALLIFLFAFCMPVPALSETTIYDAHIHYNQDVWSSMNATETVEYLQENNIQRAMVSSTPTEGTEKIYRENSEVVIPMLRPYRNWKDTFLWSKNPDLKNYLLKHLQRVPYRGIGEFHIWGDEVLRSSVKEMIQLARERKLVLHAHTDHAGMQHILRLAPDIPVIWAHGGFDVPVPTLRKLLKGHSNFYIDLALREGMLDQDDLLHAEWKTLLENFQDRFLVGMDTYKPSFWVTLPDRLAQTRDWLKQVSPSAQRRIASENVGELFP